MPTGNEIAAQVTNFTWSAFFGLVIAVINGSALGYWIKTRPNMRKLAINADEQMRIDLMARLGKVEEQLEQQRQTYEARLEQERTTHAADMAVMRHRMSNLDQCLTMLLMLIEQDPEKAREAASRVRQMRERQEISEAAEKAAIHGAKIAATSASPAGAAA